MRLKFCLMLLLSLSANAIALDARTEAKILEKYPLAKVISSDTGSLDSGAIYTAAVIFNRDESDYSLRMVVLRNNEASGPNIASISEPWVRHERLTWNVKIDNSVIYLSESGSGGCCSMQEQIFKFRERSNGILLVGVESKDLGINPREESPIYFEYGTSSNFLSGKAIHWGKYCQAKGNDEFACQGKSRRKEVTATFSVSKKWNSNNFSFDEFGDWLIKTPGICGFIDESLSLSTCQGNL